MMNTKDPEDARETGEARREEAQDRREAAREAAAEAAERAREMAAERREAARERCEEDAGSAVLPGLRQDYDVLFDGEDLAARNRFTGVETGLEDIATLRFDDISVTRSALFETLSAETVLVATGGPGQLQVNTPDPTPSVLWDQVVQAVVAELAVGPTLAARSYALLHTAIYDAWASFDADAARVSIDIEGDNIRFADPEPEIQEAAMHVAAHHVLTALFPEKAGVFDTVLAQRLELDEVPVTAAAAGMDAAEDLLHYRAGELARAADTADPYSPVNAGPDAERVDIARWTPVPQGVLSDTPDELQTFLTPEFRVLEGFGLPERPDGTTDFEATRPEGPEPFFTTAQQGASLDVEARTVTLAAEAEIAGRAYAAGETVAVDKALIGPVINPDFIRQAEDIVAASAGLTEREKLVAEFWEDGKGTSFPPGTWMTFAQYVSERDDHGIAEDALLFMTMGNAVFDAAIATWDAKVHFDYARPVTVIRDLGALGLIGEPGTDALTGETGYVIEAYAGLDPETGESLGTRTILAENFITYQLPGGEFSPPFAEYTSGHSTFSAAGAEVLRAFTGSDSFGASVTLAPGTSDFDPALPAQETIFAWDTFSEAAEGAGLSRIYGGIHFEDGDLDGRATGETYGADAYDLGTRFAEGDITDADRPFFEEYFVL